jgi:DNA-binding MarR family transcriptional regulator
LAFSIQPVKTPNNPTDLAKRLNSHRPTVSQAINGLARKNLVKRINPNEKNISIYGLTLQGKKVLSFLHDMKKGVAADSD